MGCSSCGTKNKEGATTGCQNNGDAVQVDVIK